jgi:hypothetical protein
MDGTTLKRELREQLGETSTGTWLDSKTSYDYLYQAAIATNSRTSLITTYQDVTTVANQATYYLNGDFLKLFRKDDSQRLFVRYYDGTNYSFIYWKGYDDIILENNTTSVSIPSCFSITDAPAISQVTGTADSDATSSGGESSLVDATGTFTNVFAGDTIHNTTDGSNGIIVSKTSSTTLVTALFDGTGNDWTTADAYKLNHQMRFYLVLDPPPSTASHTIRVYYVQKPTPVYSSYKSYNFPEGFSSAIVRYAAWLYKYRDSEPNFGDGWFKYWDMTVRQFGREMNQALNRKGFTVSFTKD